MIKKLNKLLESESPVQLTKTLEVFVSLLRNKPNSKPVDVELFMKDRKKLVGQMGRTETTSVSEEIAQNAITELEKFSGGISDNVVQNIDDYQCFVEWSLNFAQAAMIDLKIKKISEQIKAV